jgi:hypothetical protein
MQRTVPVLCTLLFFGVLGHGTPVNATKPVRLPSTPSAPSPADGATGVTSSPTLTWSSQFATSYDVYFGTSPAADTRVCRAEDRVL